MSYPGDKAYYTQDFIKLWEDECVSIPENWTSEEWIDIQSAWKFYQMGINHGKIGKDK